MSEAVVELAASPEAGPGFLNIRIGWRNLWRNRRRTWLTSGGIAFAILLVVFTMSMQAGMYSVAMENATSLMTGHVQIQNAEYPQDSRFEDTIIDASEVLDEVRSIPGVVAVTPRVEAFSLVSAGERSFGSQVLGIDIEAEQEIVRFVKMLDSGRQIAGPGEAVIGTILARNLGVGLGDELVILGTGKEGGVAAMVVDVVGLLNTGMSDLDRVLLLADIGDVQAAFGLEGEVHTLVITGRDLDRSEAVTRVLSERMPAHLVVRHWSDVLPELKQAIEVDRLGGAVMYWLIMMLVVFSVINSFIMTVFERRKEFGMLRAIGMKPGGIIAMVQWEALFVCLVGVAIAMAIALPLVWWLTEVGIYVGEQMQEMAAQFYMPARMHAAFDTRALLTAPIVMLIGTQFAALLPALRIRGLRPVEALRDA